MLSRFHLIPERNGQTDGRTDGQTNRFAMSISRVSMLTRDKNATTAAAAAEFICHEKNIHVYINVKDRRAARKE